MVKDAHAHAKGNGASNLVTTASALAVTAYLFFISLNIVDLKIDLLDFSLGNTPKPQNPVRLN